MTALMFASKRGHIDIVKVLLTVPGIDANIEDEVKKQVVVIVSNEMILYYDDCCVSVGLYLMS